MRRVLLAAAALVAGVVGLVPATSGAWTASLSDQDVAGVSQWYSCAAAVTALGPSTVFDWNLADAVTSATASDASSANLQGTYAGNRTLTSVGAPGGCGHEQAQSASFDGTSTWVGSGSWTVPAGFATGFSLSAWVRTPAGWSGGGDIVMLCNAPATASACTSRDYRMYLTSSGAVVFGVADSSSYTQTVRTAGVVNDGAWHHVAGTLSATAGVHVFLDGTDVTSTATALSTYFNPPYGSTSTTAAAIRGSRTTTTTGYWRVGMGDGAPNWPGHNPFNANDQFVYLKGQLTGVSVFRTTLTGDQVASLAASGR